MLEFEPGHSLESGQQPPRAGGARSPSAQNSSSQIMFEQKLLDFRDLVTAPGKLAGEENPRKFLEIFCNVSERHKLSILNCEKRSCRINIMKTVFGHNFVRDDMKYQFSFLKDSFKSLHSLHFVKRLKRSFNSTSSETSDDFRRLDVRCLQL